MPNHRYRSAKAWQKISPAAHLAECEVSRCTPPEQASKKRFAKKGGTRSDKAGKVSHALAIHIHGRVEIDSCLGKELKVPLSQSIYMGELKSAPSTSEDSLY